MNIQIYRVKKPHEPTFYVAVIESEGPSQILSYLSLDGTSVQISPFKSMTINDSDHRVAFDSQKAIRGITEVGYYVVRPQINIQVTSKSAAAAG